ncbi:MAG: ribosome assembly factor SBDS [Nanoarchaeota archaeon]
MAYSKLNLAKIKRFGQTFEISINTEKALQYKKGALSDVSDVLLADKVFTDAKKGLVAASSELQNAFQTTDVNKIADFILKKGEIQATSEHRAREREQQKLKLINLIHKQAVEPKTGLPHPPERIEAALEQGRIHLDINRSAEEQFSEIISKLKPLLPLKIEKKKMSVTIPAQYAGKARPFIKSNASLLKEEWTNDGCWKVLIEIPAGMQMEFINWLNSITRGDVVVEIL